MQMLKKIRRQIAAICRKLRAKQPIYALSIFPLSLFFSRFRAFTLSRLYTSLSPHFRTKITFSNYILTIWKTEFG
jgi:hypothetical protein